MKQSGKRQEFASGSVRDSRDGKCLRHSLESSQRRASADASRGGCFDWGHRGAVHEHRDAVSLVLALFLASRPSAIVWAVRAVVVSALDRVAGWTRPHVSQERGEVVAPLVTDRDASAAVVREVSVPFVETPDLQSNPYPILARNGPLSIVAVLERLLGFHRAGQTPAAPTVSGLKVWFGNSLHGSAVTTAGP